MTDFWTIVGGISAALAGLAVVAGWVSRSKWARMRAQTRHNLHTMALDWVGEPERVGFEGRPSFPGRMERVEKRTEILQHDFATETTSRLTLIGLTVDKIEAQSGETTSAVARLDYRMNGIDARIADHKLRNQQQVAELSSALEQWVQTQEARNDSIDNRLSTISNDLLRGETYRASLVELGIPVDERDP